ncbi:MAG TPA: glycosyl hydrolase, partial [Cytophagales bacterium]|nr:glycosyl hydrolase [Cytophagales bacterium]
VNWENENIPAIVEAWYPGQAAGQAIADVLFGDYNPAGRLPVTFYKSVKDLPPFDEYKISNQTYRYYTGTPLYPFGYGLSYTTFQYADLAVDKTNPAVVSISAMVKNTGSFAGDEVVQVYLSSQSDSRKPLRALEAFKRIHLKPGEVQQVTFIIDSKQIGEGQVEISIGGGQPDVKNKTTSNVLKRIL